MKDFSDKLMFAFPSWVLLFLGIGLLSQYMINQESYSLISGVSGGLLLFIREYILINQLENKA